MLVAHRQKEKKVIMWELINKHLMTTVTDQNNIHKSTGSRSNSGHAASVSSEYFSVIIVPVLYGCETLHSGKKLDEMVLRSVF
jgi:hypothetical protein